MSMHVNLTAYEGVEDFSRFDSESFAKYCNEKLASCDKHIAFIRKHLPLMPLRVLEVGSGSGKLLFRLEKEGMLEKGVGFELSKSRSSFAEQFGRYMNSRTVNLFNEDYLAAEVAKHQFDLIIGIDIVINLIGPLSSNHVNLFMEKCLDCLAPGGFIILESITLKRELDFINKSENGCYRTWKNFPETDPFKYGLDELRMDTDQNIVWNKNFINRTSLKEERFTNILKPMSPEIFRSLAGRYGMDVDFFDFWDIFDDTSDQEFVVLLKKK